MMSSNLQQELKYFNLPRSLIQAFRNIKFERLRNIQKEALTKGILKGKSLLTIAPSGSGKTFLAELAAITNILKNSLNTLYLVPLKALATEKYHSFKKRYAHLNINIVTAVGDQEVPSFLLEQANLLIMTYEKFDSYLRSNIRFSWINRLGTIIIDEIHNIGDHHRGPRLESLIIRLYHQLNPPQMIYLSATVGNPNILFTWIQKLETKYRDQDLALIMNKKRPVQLKYHILVTKNKQEVIKKIFQKAVKDGDQLLVFTNSRKRAEKLTQFIQNLVYSSNRNNNDEINLFLKKNNYTKDEISSEVLNLFSYGLSFHHAGLNTTERQCVEAAFRQNIINLIVTTTSLSSGVNLPAKIVILNDLYFYERNISQIKLGAKNQYKFTKNLLNRNLFHQICGRAGRPGYDNEGIIYILTDEFEEKFLIQNTYFHKSKNLNLEPKYDSIRSSIPLNKDLLLETILLKINEAKQFTYFNIINFIQDSLFSNKIINENIPINNFLNIYPGDLISLLKTFASLNFLSIVRRCKINLEISEYDLKKHIKGKIHLIFKSIQGFEEIANFLTSVQLDTLNEKSPIVIERLFEFSLEQENVCSCESFNFKKKSLLPHIKTPIHPLSPFCLGKTAVVYAFFLFFREQEIQTQKSQIKIINQTPKPLTLEKNKVENFLYKSIYPKSLLERLREMDFIRGKNLPHGVIACTKIGKITLKSYIPPSISFAISKLLKPLIGRRIDLFSILSDLIHTLRKNQYFLIENIDKAIELWISEKSIDYIIYFINLKVQSKKVYKTDVINNFDKLTRILKFIAEFFYIYNDHYLQTVFLNYYYRVKYGIKQDLVIWAKTIPNYDIRKCRILIGSGISTPGKFLLTSNKELRQIMKLPFQTIKNLKTQIKI